MTDPDDLTEQMIAWLQARDSDRAAVYAREGRRFSGLPSASLSVSWLNLFQKVVDAPTDGNLRKDLLDMESEHILRGLVVPMDAVPADVLNRYADFAASTLQNIEENNPTRFAEIDAEILADLAQFDRDRESGN